MEPRRHIVEYSDSSNDGICIRCGEFNVFRLLFQCVGCGKHVCNRCVEVNYKTCGGVSPDGLIEPGTGVYEYYMCLDCLEDRDVGRSR